jgi:hypothetical protein
MRLYRLLIYATAFFAIILQAGSAMAAHQGMADYQRQKMSGFTTPVANLKAELQQTGPDNWDDAKLSEYGVNVCWLLYHAINSYVFERDELPNSLDDLISAGLITEIPGNPLRNWEPVRMLELSDGFSGLDLVIQKAPYNYQSLVGSFDNYTLQPLSFELAVYGPRVDHYQGSVNSPNVNNKDWALSPAGALLMAGTFSETAETTLQKLQKYYDEHTAVKNSEGQE